MPGRPPRRAARRYGFRPAGSTLRASPRACGPTPLSRDINNQKRHGLTPLDLARFIRTRADACESNAVIAKRLGMDLTSVAHHLALLNLPAELSDAMRAGRCTSPRTLYELAKIHREEPERVRALLDGGCPHWLKALAQDWVGTVAQIWIGADTPECLAQGRSRELAYAEPSGWRFSAALRVSDRRSSVLARRARLRRP